MEQQDLTKSESEFAGFVDHGTQLVLQDAIKKIVEAFQQTDALEDILKYLEETRTNIQTQTERIKDIEQVIRQSNDRNLALETSTRGLLQRIQSMEVQIAENTKRLEENSKNLEETSKRMEENSQEALRYIERFAIKLERLVMFFEQPPLKRLLGKIEGPSSLEQ